MSKHAPPPDETGAGPSPELNDVELGDVSGGAITNTVNYRPGSGGSGGSGGGGGGTGGDTQYMSVLTDAYQEVSSTSKTLYDTATSIIKNIGG